MSDTLSSEGDLAKLKKCVEDLRPRIESNAWLQAMLKSFNS